MRCSNCQRKVSSKDSVCPYCGAKIVAENEINQYFQDNEDKEYNKNTEIKQQNEEFNVQPTYQDENLNSQKNTKINKIIITILEIISASLFFIGSMLFLFDNSIYKLFISLSFIIILFLCLLKSNQKFTNSSNNKSKKYSEYNPDADLLSLLSFILLFIGLLPIILAFYGKFTQFLILSPILLLFGLPILIYTRLFYPNNESSSVFLIIIMVIFLFIVLHIFKSINTFCTNCNMP